MQILRSRLKYKFTAVLFLFALAVSVANGVIYFHIASEKVTDDLKQRLKEVAATASLMIDQSAHDMLLHPQDEGSKAYASIKRTLQNVRDASSDIHFIYTMRRGFGDEIVFVVDAEDNVADMARLGETYEEPSELLAKNFATMTDPMVEPEPYSDEFGTWLSGYAPFFRPDGQLAGVIGIDIAASKLVEYHRQLIFTGIGLFAATLPFIFLAGLYLSTRLARPIVELRNAADQLGQGDLETRVDIANEDEIGELATSFNDMTEKLKLYQDNIREIAEKYRSIFNNALEGIFQVTPQGRFITANRAMLTLLGRDATQDASPVELGNIETEVFVNPEDWHAMLSAIGEHGEVRAFSTRLRRTDGSEFWCEISARPEQDKNGEGFIEGLVDDVTERLEREAAQRDSEKAQAASKAKSVFLDNSGQGFLSFGQDRVIDPQFSRECKRLLGDDIAGKLVDELLFPDDAEKRTQFDRGVKLILNELDPFRRDMFLSLMPGEFTFGDTVVRAEYKVAETDRIMMILTDVTLERQLRAKAALEHERLKLVVSSVRDSRDFFDITEGFEKFQNMDFEQLQANGKKVEPSELYREVHTYKGLFSQMDFIHTPQALHELESDIAPLLKDLDDRANVPDLSSRIKDCHSAYLNDLGIIKENLGEEYLNQGAAVCLSTSCAKDLSTLADELAALGNVPQDLLDRVACLKDLNKESLRTLLGQYTRAVERLAKQLEKDVNPFVIEGEDIPVDPDRFAPLVHSLAHVFRNVMDHGVETPEERFDADKDEAATVTCEVRMEDGEVVIEITDDGRGVDVDALRERAVAAGVVSAEQAQELSREQTLDLAFAMGLSTKDEATDLSGRGVGLAAVREAAHALGGETAMASEPGRGTIFVVRVPLT